VGRTDGAERIDGSADSTATTGTEATGPASTRDVRMKIGAARYQPTGSMTARAVATISPVLNGWRRAAASQPSR
jgi:hypothetical protein